MLHQHILNTSFTKGGGGGGGVEPTLEKFFFANFWKRKQVRTPKFALL